MMTENDVNELIAKALADRKLTDGEIKILFEKAEGKATLIAHKQADRGRNQALGIFAFLGVVLAVLGALRLDQAAKTAALEALTDASLIAVQKEAEEARDAAKIAAGDATGSARTANEILSQLMSREFVCRKLIIENPEKKAVITLGGNAAGGTISVADSKGVGKATIDVRGPHGWMSTSNGWRSENEDTMPSETVRAD